MFSFSRQSTKSSPFLCYFLSFVLRWLRGPNVVGQDLQIFIFSETVCSIHRSRCQNVGNNSVIFGWIAFRSVS